MRNVRSVGEIIGKYMFFIKCYRCTVVAAYRARGLLTRSPIGLELASSDLHVYQLFVLKDTLHRSFDSEINNKNKTNMLTFDASSRYRCFVVIVKIN